MRSDRLKKTRASFSTNEKQKQNQSHLVTRDFCRTLSKLHVIAWNSHWFSALLASVMTGRSNYFGISFSTVVSVKTALKAADC